MWSEETSCWSGHKGAYLGSLSQTRVSGVSTEYSSPIISGCLQTDSHWETSTCEQVIFFLKTSYLNTGRGSHMNPQTGFIHSKCTSWVATTQSDRLSKPVVHPRHSTGDWAWHRSRLQSQRACCPVGEVMPGLKREADQNRHKRTNNQMQTVDSDLDKPSKVISGIIKEIWIQANETKELLSILVHEIMAMQLWKRTLLLK